jgi:hypothetical protein
MAIRRPVGPDANTHQVCFLRTGGLTALIYNNSAVEAGRSSSRCEVALSALEQHRRIKGLADVLGRAQADRLPLVSLIVADGRHHHGQ